MKTRYGWVEIDGIRYDHDVIVHADRQVTKRSKKRSKKYKKRYGHTPLALDELNFLKTEKPQVVYIGTGQFGDLPLPVDTLCMLREYEPVIRPTPEVLEYLENETRVAVAILHVSC
jgi:hypothetical protein